MFYKIFNGIKEITDYTTVIIVILVGLFTLLFDGKSYKQKGYIKELKIIKIISYSYITIGGLLYVLMLFM